MSEIRPAPSAGRLRSPPARALIAAALAVSLLLAGAFLMSDRLHSSPSDDLDHPADPISDEQSRAQVVDPAQQIVSSNDIHPTSAGYMLMSCRDRKDPPYQGAIYLTFALPTVPADAYFRSIAAALTARGWTEGLPPNEHVFGSTFTRNGVTMTIYRRDDDPGFGVLRLHGECRNITDHRADPTTWVDITDRFKSA